MERKSKISLYLLWSATLLFLALSILMVLNAYKSAEKQFKFSKQYYLSTAFYQINLNVDKLQPLADIIKANITHKKNISESKNKLIDSIIKDATNGYEKVAKNFSRLLQKDNIDTTFEIAVIVSKFSVQYQDTLFTLYDIENAKSYLLLSGNPDNLVKRQPDNIFFYKLGKYNINLQVAVYIHFPKITLYLLKKIAVQLAISLLMLLLLTGIVIYTIKTIKRQQLVDQMKTDFINNMTHELKTPLTTLTIASKTLHKENIEDTRILITKQVKRLEIIIDRVMELSSLNKNQINKQLIQIHTFFEQIVATFKTNYTQTELVFKNISPNDQILLDAFLMETAIMNILDNSKKYGADNPVQVLLRKEKYTLYITIKDRGLGIAPQHQKLIFEKFYRVPQGNRHDIKGSGLGLYYVKQIISAHSGKIVLHSIQNQETTITISIPIR